MRSPYSVPHSVDVGGAPRFLVGQGRSAVDVRRRRYRAGLRAELIAMVVLWVKGYQILGWRCKTPHGEIDLVVRRGGRLAFVEVKHRSCPTALIDAIAPRQVRRVERAAEAWMARHPQYSACDVGLDAMLISPWRRPQHRENYLTTLVVA